MAARLQSRPDAQHAFRRARGLAQGDQQFSAARAARSRKLDRAGTRAGSAQGAAPLERRNRIIAARRVSDAPAQAGWTPVVLADDAIGNSALAARRCSTTTPVVGSNAGDLRANGNAIAADLW